MRCRPPGRQGCSKSAKSQRPYKEENTGLGTNNHFSAVVKGDVEAPGEVTPKNSLSAKHTDDGRMSSLISQLCNLYLTQIGGSKDACDVIGEGKAQIAVWRFAIGHKVFGDNQVAIKAGIKECLNRLSTLVEDNGNRKVGEMRVGKCWLLLPHSH